MNAVDEAALDAAWDRACEEAAAKADALVDWISMQTHGPMAALVMLLSCAAAIAELLHIGERDMLVMVRRIYARANANKEN